MLLVKLVRYWVRKEARRGQARCQGVGVKSLTGKNIYRYERTKF